MALSEVRLAKLVEIGLIVLLQELLLKLQLLQTQLLLAVEFVGLIRLRALVERYLVDLAQQGIIA